MRLTISTSKPIGLATVLLLGLTSSAGAQPAASGHLREFAGVVGSLYGGATHFEQTGHVAGTRGSFGFRLGFRARLPECMTPDRFRIGADLAFAATDITGLTTLSDSFAFSSLEGRLVASVRALPSLRLYGYGGVASR